MNLDKEMKQKLFEQNGLSDDESVDKIQAYLIDRWEQDEKKMRHMKGIVKWLWIGLIMFFLFHLFFILGYESIEDTLEKFAIDGLIEMISLLLSSIAPIILLCAVYATILYYIRFASHKRQFESMLNQKNLNKQLSRIETLVAQLVEEKKTQNDKEGKV